MTNKKSSNMNKRKIDAEYISGNTVRKLYVAEPLNAPERERKRRVRTEEDESLERARRAKIRHANRVNFLYTVAVTAVVAVIFTICYQYLNLQSEVKNNSAVVTQMQDELTQLTSQNDENEMAINAGINYEQIYNTAVNELGMVYPDRQQVIKYNPGVSEYVKQYQDVPTDK